MSVRPNAFWSFSAAPYYLQQGRYPDDAAFLYAPVYGTMFYAGISVTIRHKTGLLIWKSSGMLKIEYENDFAGKILAPSS
ncbi:MAG: hypothetical protein EOM06_12125 [Sphingobacteriia bacterium]|nr:hypothetical protein [Sphingobacteriia bacterium]